MSDKSRSNIRYYYERAILLLYFGIAFVLIFTIFNAIVNYPEPYLFFKETFSRLGGITSSAGTSNDSGRAIFATGFQICSLLTLTLGFAYLYWDRVIQTSQQSELSQSTQSDTNENIKSKSNLGFAILCFIMSGGFLLLTVPYDHPRLTILHIVGVVMFVGGFATLNFYAQIHRRALIGSGNGSETSKANKWGKNVTFVEKFLIGAIFILGVIYCVAFFLDFTFTGNEILHYLNASSQKAIVITCIIAIFNLDPDDVLM
ncbi:MAG: hypothetical protein ACTSRK_08245 [Promethearchaeota archaeon]